MKIMSNAKCSKLFDPNFVANSLAYNYRCPSCKSEYSWHFDKTNKDQHIKSNRPILLPCGHNMCENCIYHNRQNLTCMICFSPIIINKESCRKFFNFNVRDFFDMNFFLMGQLYHWRYYQKEGSGNTTLFMSAVGQSNLNSTLIDADTSVGATSIIKCVECELLPSLGKCRVCKVYYCKRCFDNVHKNSKVLKKHTMEYFDKQPTQISELVRLTKSRFCRKHQRQCDRYCKKCDIVCCGECARLDHQHHRYRKLLDENENLLQELHLTLENAQLARENLNKGQKDIKNVESQLEEYATKTLEKISNYFIELHSFLQNEEKQIMGKFCEMSQITQSLLREANLKLNESQQTLNSIRSALEQYQYTPPANIYLGHILPKYNQLIQQIPSSTQITKLHNNPFIFEVQGDIRPDIHKSIYCDYQDPKLLIKIDTSFYDSSPSVLDTTSISIPSTLNMTHNHQYVPSNQRPKKFFKLIKSNKKVSQPLDDVSMTNVTDVKNSKSVETNLVHVTYIKSPDNFYIQNINDVHQIRKLSHTYLCNGIANDIPKEITEGLYYMAYHVTDKQWYRGLLKKILSNDLYKIFLVDFGLSMEVTKNNLCDIEENHLKVPFAAIRCAIYDIMPTGKKWTEVEKNLLIELLQNKPARISIIEKVSNDMFKIDLHTDLTKSIHDTFLYTGLARKEPGAQSFKLQLKANLPIIKTEERIAKISISSGEIIAVSVLHVDGPEEFYVIKNELIESKEELKMELNHYYDNNSSELQQIYLGAVQMCCAVHINGVWHRALIEDIKDKGQLVVRLVDEGHRETINWRQAFILLETFRNRQEFAIPCTLADIEPLQENSYVYTSAAIKDFKQMTANPNLRMEVVAIKMKICEVILYICKPALDINIGASLVKNNYGISTGESTQVVEIVKTPKFSKNDQPLTVTLNHDSMTPLVPTITTIKRTMINITHFISPGEFYIQLANLVQGTKHLHQQIQETQAKKFDNKQPLPHETREWYKDNHCLVYTKQHSSQAIQPVVGTLSEQCEWYRGIITEITNLPGEETTYSIFLRDIGATICSIYSQQLYSIDPLLDRVTNAVYCCHLACIGPAGGETWSKSAIDSFAHYIKNAEGLSASLHGKRNRDRNSLAIVLWSSKVETANPLAPCITKYFNINRNLVRKGLAHMLEPLDAKQQFEQIEEIELENGEITLEKWFKSFTENILLKEIDDSEKLSSHLLSANNDDDDDVDDNIIENDNHSLYKHLNDMDFKDTTGQKAPAAWFSSKNIPKTLFSAYPTYIDFDAVVYLHEANDKNLLQRITKELTDTYGSKEPPSTNSRFAIDQACVVKYYLDSKYYRGIISGEDINSKSGGWWVKFIDYGNVESVECKDLRPFAPFPNLPAMASKYIIDGIKPKDGAAKFSMNELDQMHTILVTKFVSISILTSELQKNIKRCSMRLGAIDVATDFIERGLAEASYQQICYKTVAETKLKLLSSLKNDTSILASCKSRKSRNPLPSPPIDDYTIFSQGNDMSVDGIYQQANAVETEDEDINNLSDYSDVETDYKNSAELYHLNKMLSRLPNDNNMNQLTNPMEKNDIENSTNTNNATNKPPPKKRMFNDKDYTKMMNVLMVYDTDDNIEQDFDHKFIADGEEDDEDIIDLGESFAMDYWHNTVEDMHLEDDEAISEPMERKEVLSLKEDIESEFDAFYPYETSTFLSHISGIENFKTPQLPTAMHHFNCRVVAIITPRILQIFPQHTEFHYRDLELQRSIQEMVRRSLPPLIKFEPRTQCLACYSKDKKWYRAIIRSYNPVAKTVDVFYVDYLNSETLPLKYVLQCPKELLGWPLRTFRVRLHGIEVNPKVKEHEIRLKLHRLLAKRRLFAVVKKHPICNSMFLGKASNKNDHIEIALYESKEASLRGITIYEPLIEKNYFQRL